MKAIIIFLFIGSLVQAQSYTEKYNELYNRIDYTNSQGKLIGYKYYDDLYKVWKYKDLTVVEESSYIDPINTDYVNRALQSKDARYNNNVNQIQNTINNITNKVRQLPYSESIKQSILNDFNSKCLRVIDRTNYDYSKSSTAQSIINFLYKGINTIIEDNKPQQPNNSPTSSPSSESTTHVYNRTFSGRQRVASYAPLNKEPILDGSKIVGYVKDGQVDIIEKTNEKFYKVKDGKLTGYLFVGWILDGK